MSSKIVRAYTKDQLIIVRALKSMSSKIVRANTKDQFIIVNV